MPFNARCWMLPTAGLAAAMIFLTGCAGAGFEGSGGACPPVVDYSRAEQARVAEEVAALQEGALIAEWLADYAVLRDQVRACASHPPSRRMEAHDRSGLSHPER